MRNEAFNAHYYKKETRRSMPLDCIQSSPALRTASAMIFLNSSGLTAFGVRLILSYYVLFSQDS